MTRKQSLHLHLTAAQLMGEGIKRARIVELLSQAFGVSRWAVYAALRNLLNEPGHPRDYAITTKGIWARSPLIVQRLAQLQESHESGQSRQEIIKHYSESWKVSPGYVSHLFSKMLAEDHRDLVRQREEHMQLYADQIRAMLEKQIDSRDHKSAAKTVEKISLLRA